MVAGLLEPCGKELRILEGGTSAWIKAGLRVVATSVTRWSLERQVRFAAGLLALTGVVLALTVSLRWIYLSGFIGLGLTFSGVSGLCPMGSLLGLMPWNRGALAALKRQRLAAANVRDGAHCACSNRRANNGGVKAFEKLANEHKDAVYRNMIRVCGNREDAEDVLIEALLKAYRHLDQLHDDRAFQPWLGQIARRVCWQLKKREALLPLLQLSMLEEEGKDIQNDEPPVDAQLAAREMKELFKRAVHHSPPLYQDLLSLRDIEDLPGRP